MRVERPGGRRRRLAAPRVSLGERHAKSKPAVRGDGFALVSRATASWKLAPREGLPSMPRASLGLARDRRQEADDLSLAAGSGDPALHLRSGRAAGSRQDARSASSAGSAPTNDRGGEGPPFRIRNSDSRTTTEGRGGNGGLDGKGRFEIRDLRFEMQRPGRAASALPCRRNRTGRGRFLFGGEDEMRAGRV